jgi:5'-methylthioadenosine phosphorylase
VFVVPDQLIDRTWGRADTFYDRDDVQHLPAADPYPGRVAVVP